MSSEKVAFNYLRENFTEPGQPIVHGLVNFKQQLVPDIPNVKFSGLEFKILEYWFDWSASGSTWDGPGIPDKGYKTLPTGTYKKQLCICILPNFSLHLVVIEIGCLFFRKAIPASKPLIPRSYQGQIHDF